MRLNRSLARLVAWIAILLVPAALPLRAATVIISEFAASNGNGLQDEDGAFSDWIELFNTSTNTVNLNGWSLTDDDDNLTKWRLPATNLPPNSFLVVFASGKNRAVPGQPLHANFSLSAGGEYLALVQSNGVIATEFAPAFPEQFGNISYGLGQEVQVTRLIDSDVAARVFIPLNGALGLTWTATNFNDASWLAGTNGVGFEAFTPGFAVRNIRANIGVCDMSTADAVLATPSLQSAVFNDDPATVNYVNTGDDAHFGGGATFPGFSIGVDMDHFVVEATGVITIPTSGTWTFGVNSDDGFRLTVGSQTMSYPYTRGPSDTFATFTLAAGEYPVQLVFYECGGGSEVEIFAAQGSHGGFDSAFRLVGDTSAGGLAAKHLSGSAGGALRPLIATDVQTQMMNLASSAYVRLPFSVANPAAFSTLTLRMKYDDGFVAYLNGTEVARRNSPATPQWNSLATAAHPTAAALVFEDIDVSSQLGLLRAGTNVLALHGLNDAANGADFVLLAELVENKVTGLTNHYFATPSPGAFNSEGFIAFVNELQFAPNRGWFINTPISVTITSVLSGVTIRYTTDGSAPTASTGQVYAGPIPVNRTTVLRAAGFHAGFQPSVVETHSYIFLDQVQQQNITSNYVGGSSGDYTLDTGITRNPPYRDTFTNDLVSIPTLSIAMSWGDLFGPNGIWSNVQGYGVGWERPCSLEYLRPDGAKGFHINCGIRIQGGVSRDAVPKHGLRVLFKGIYGASKLDYDLYPDSPVKEFDTLTLHGSFNDHWLNVAGSSATVQRDQWCRDAQNATGGYGPHGTYVHLYLNGLYWGVYNIGEKGDASFAAHYLGGDKSEYDAFNSDELIDGTSDAWNAMLAIVDAGIATDAAYTNISQYLNIPNFIDYMLVNFYTENTDWPGHNWNAARRRVPGGLFHFFSWDAEWTFGLDLGGGSDRTGVSDGSPGRIYASLRQHPEFVRQFGDHAQKLCFNGGALTPAAALARWDARAAEIDRAIVGETARWGGGNTRDTWLNAGDSIRTWFPQHASILINQLRNAGLYPALNAPGLSPFGGLVPPASLLTLNNPNASGAIYFTLDGTDPRLWGGGLSPGAQLYSTPLAVTNAGIIRARVRNGASWSALVEAPFYILQDYARLAVTEIMYHPPGTNSDEFEFLELKNTGTNALDLTGLLFTDGISFSFTNGTLLAPGQFFVLARNAAAFALRYPGVTIKGLYTGKLDNAGEKITLRHTLGTNIFSFSYATEPPWPITPDGYGFSLVRGNVAGDPAIAGSWRASGALFGSSGADDPAVSIPAVVINEVLTHTDPPQLDSIELFNPTAGSANIGGWYLSDDHAQPKKFRVPNGISIPAGGFVVFNETNFNALPGTPTNFALSSLGEPLLLFSGDASTNLTGYSHSFNYGASANGVSFGRYRVSTGDENWPAQIAVTLGATNSGPRIGPIVINEIQYHPPAGYDEFIELHNLSGGPVPLYDPANSTNTWRVNGLGYVFPTNTSVPAGGFVLLVPIAPAAFRTKYAVPGAVQVLGPYPGSLQNDGERLSLERPDTPNTNLVPYLVVDEVRYHDKAPWPVSADGDGPSLQRLHPGDYGNEPTNWFASGITPGAVNQFNQGPICALTSPANGATFIQPTNIVLNATATDADGVILGVEFYDGVIKLGEDTNAPYSLVWSNAPVGPHTLTAKARDNGLAIGISVPAVITLNPPPVGSGIGLRGDYFDDFGFTGTRLRRIDPTVSFSWFGGSPDPSMEIESFSIRWTGKVQPRFSETYTFYTVSDDGVRLWVNGQLLIDNWGDHGDTEDAGQIALQAGQLYDLKMEFYENGGYATAYLSWSSPGTTKEVIPASQLYPAPDTNQPPTITLIQPSPGLVFLTSAAVNVSADATDPDGSVTNVDFYADILRLGGVAAAPFTFTWTNLSAGAYSLFAVATDDGNLSHASAPVDIGVVNGYTTNLPLVATGAVWKYRDTGEDLGDLWSTLAYNDAGWSNGAAQLGYGDGDEVTAVGFGPDPNNKYITTYFRREFVVNDPTAFDVLQLGVLRDDGVAVHINGTEVFRNNLPTGPINFQTTALNGAGEGEETSYFFEGTIDPGVLVFGTNVVAAEVHQVNNTSSDISFDLRLTASRTFMGPWVTVPPSAQTVMVGSNATLNVTAIGTAPLFYQWRFNGSNLPGQTNAVLNLPAVQTGQQGAYTVRVTNYLGSTLSSAAMLTVALPDTDGDGMPDEWEQLYSLDPEVNDAALDPDQDGQSNLQEYFAGTNPQDAQSVFRLRFTGDPGGPLLRLNAISNRTYTVQFNDRPSASGWSNYFTVPAAPTNCEWLIPVVPTNHFERYFRAVTPSHL